MRKKADYAGKNFATMRRAFFYNDGSFTTMRKDFLQWGELHYHEKRFRPTMMRALLRWEKLYCSEDSYNEE